MTRYQPVLTGHSDKRQAVLVNYFITTQATWLTIVYLSYHTTITLNWDCQFLLLLLRFSLFVNACTIPYIIIIKYFIQTLLQ